MTNSPEEPRSFASRGAALLLLVLAVGAGMYLLGRHSHSAPVPAKEGQTAQTSQAVQPSQTAPNSAASPAGSPAVAAASPGGTGGRRLAPHDTFYLLEYASVKTPTGVEGFEPGQEVHLVEVRHASRTLVVANDRAQVEVGPEKLTNDLDIAALVRQKDLANQAKIAAYVQAEQKAYDDSKRESAIKAEQALDKIDQQKQQQAATAANNVRQSASATGVNTGSKLDEPAVQVGGTSGYGSSGSSYYGSPYSYFGGSVGTTTSAPAYTGGGAASRGANPATIGH